MRSAFDDFALHQAGAAILELVAAANRYADAQEPWTLSKRAVAATEAQARADLLAQLAHVLWRLLEALRVTAILIAPFLPGAARAVADRLRFPGAQLRDYGAARFGDGPRFRPAPGAPLFPRLGG